MVVFFTVDQKKPNSTLSLRQSSVAQFFDHLGDEGGVELLEGIDREDVGRFAAGDEEQLFSIDGSANADGDQLDPQRPQLLRRVANLVSLIAGAVGQNDQILGDAVRFARGVVEDIDGSVHRLSRGRTSLQILDAGDLRLESFFAQTSRRSEI